jgi:hypothetical protein
MADSQETKIRKGQAFNLAINDAVHNGQSCNPKYIYQKFVYYHALGDAIQGSDLDMIQEVIDSKDFDKVMEELINLLGKKEKS